MYNKSHKYLSIQRVITFHRKTIYRRTFHRLDISLIRHFLDWNVLSKYCYLKMSFCEMPQHHNYIKWNKKKHFYSLYTRSIYLKCVQLCTLCHVHLIIKQVLQHCTMFFIIYWQTIYLGLLKFNFLTTFL